MPSKRPEGKPRTSDAMDWAAPAAQSRSDTMTTSPASFASRVALFGAVLILATSAQASLAAAHDSWINRGGLRNPAGAWCRRDHGCGPPDPLAARAQRRSVGGPG